VETRPAGERDRHFVVEMARLACGLDDRPLPSSDDEAVIALLPGSTDLVLVATDDREQRLGAAWSHFHEPPLLRDERGEALPEVTVAVREDARGRGIGGRLLEALAAEAAERFSALALNVHLRNPATRLYMRNGFRVAGKGRGWYGVAMVRSLDRTR
jgi:GNAT superfamily N-acetyltransferase